jgi:DNA-binding response OmpR family regulator
MSESNLQNLRTARVKTPIIVLSAMGDEVDWYCCSKSAPTMHRQTGTRELTARVRALLRRVHRHQWVLHFRMQTRPAERVVKRRGDELKRRRPSTIC